ncbi:hypothetical protein [Endozoicomonas sp. 4G]|uniref:hypothetical protein n=1 Tax=Endozoicomonas sp. 4G TaxID=2872754 RepID=UPI002078C7C6|nr:hypothetical protein [Endozoicomonas sp. 4G]
MTTRPNALGLAVAIAIGSSLISTQAQADRILQTTFVGIRSDEQTELFQTEAVVKPTLDDNQQPIPKSFTTTYPDRAPYDANHFIPTFIDSLSGSNKAISMVDLFETDENDAARKYTKILKVRNQGIFRFTHNLEQEELVIEVRTGMTGQDSLEAVDDEMDFTESLEPLSKIARPDIFDELLSAARNRAGKLGTNDDYTALATIKVDKVKVDGRTFMRLISGGDQPPELKRLGQSLFINDEALLAAATSAYFQVHVLKQDLQQQALNELLAHSKPVGYVVHVEDDTQIYPVPEGYPKLEVTEAPGEVIVFRGQTQYPSDVAFIENLHVLWKKLLDTEPVDAVETQVESYDTTSYRYVLRSRQMALLEESAAYYQHNDYFKLYTLWRIAYYEYLYQALTSATPYHAYTFKFALGHIRAASSVITPTWLQFQLERHFSFNPVIKNILNNQCFVESLRSAVNMITSKTSVNHFGDLADEGQFTAKVMGDMAEQLPEMYDRLEDLQIKEAKLLRLKNQLQQTAVPEATQHIEDELATLRAEQEILKNQEQQLQEESKSIPGLKEQFLNARNLYHSKRATGTEEPEPDLQQQEELTDKAIWNKLANPDARQHHLKHLQKLEKRKKWLQELEQEIDGTLKLREEVSDPIEATIGKYNDQLAKALNIDDWDETDYSIEAGTEFIGMKMEEISKPRQPPNEAVKSILASIESKHDITPDNENDLAARFQSIQQHLEQKIALVEGAILNRLAEFESQLDLPDNNEHLEYRQHILKQHLRKQIAQVEQEHFQQLGSRTEAEKIAATQDRFAIIAKHLNLKGFNSDADFEIQQELLLETINAMMAEKDSVDQQIKTMTHELDRENLKTTEWFSELAELKSELEDMRTPGHPKIMSEVLGKLSAVASILKTVDFDNDDDVYLRRQVISNLLQTHIVEARQRSEREALETLKDFERYFKVKINKGDDKATRLRAVRTKLDYHSFSKYLMDDSNKKLWKDDSPAMKDLQGEDRIRARLTYKVEESDQRAIEKQTEYLLAIEHELNIEPQSLDANKRKAVIDNELDRQVARLGPKPRFVLDREVAQARQALKGAESYLEEDLDIAEKDLGLKSAPSDTHRQRFIAVLQKWSKMASPDLTIGEDESDQLVKQYSRWMKKITARLENIDRIKKDLQTAEEAVKKDGGSFQYPPKQVQVLKEIHAFTQHPLKKQALQATIGLLKALEENSELGVPSISYFDDEWAPVHFHARMENTLTLEQTSRIVEVFRSLKTVPPDPSVFKEADPQNLIKTARHLAERALKYLDEGPKEYNEKILGMGSVFFEHQPWDLKSFSEYFETHSATGNKIITLLREGLISKVELEHYIKAVRGIDGYQIVAEFEHFLGDKHGVKVAEFKDVLRDLPDESAEAFMQSAFAPVTVTAIGPAGMEESVAGMKEYAAAIIANYVLDDIAFENGRKTATFLTHLQDTLTPYANVAGISESEFIMAIHDTLMQAHVAAFGRQLFDYWLKPSASLVQAVTWYYSNYRPLLATRNAQQATEQSLVNMAYLYLLDLTNRGDYLHRMLTPFQHWLEHYGVDTDRTGQYAYHSRIEQIAEVGGLAMPLGKAASSAILLKTASELFTRQYNANPQMYRSIFRLVPEMLNSMDFGQGVQVPLLHRVTPRTVKTLASAMAGQVLGPVVTVGAYAHGLISGFTYAQTFGFALTSSLAFDFFMNDNKLLTQWLAGPLGRSLDRINRWRGVGETDDDYVKRTAIASPQGFNETDEAYANRVKASNKMYGWTRHENYLQFRERRDRTMKLYENGWEQYFKNNVPKWSFSHAKSIPYSYTLGIFYKQQQGDDQTVHNKNNAQSSFLLNSEVVE